jgi:DNA-directed RNA polymerase subunit alpha
VMPIDAIFTPTKKVNYVIEPVHVGRETSLERLYLEVWTDGTISPGDAVTQSAQVLTELLVPFVSFGVVVEVQPEAPASKLPIPEELYNMPVEQLNLSVRTMNCLRRGNIQTVGEVISKGEKGLMTLRNFGVKSFVELEERLGSLGLTLKKADDQPAGESEEDEPETEES